MQPCEDFLDFAAAALKRPQARDRASAILSRWAAAWQGPRRNLEGTCSNHGAFLHFNQKIGDTWCHVFSFHASRQEGLLLRGPDPDRGRKSHKLRSHKLDTEALDALFDAWAAHPEARPAGKAVEFDLDETPDEVWAACLEEALGLLR